MWWYPEDLWVEGGGGGTQRTWGRWMGKEVVPRGLGGCGGKKVVPRGLGGSRSLRHVLGLNMMLILGAQG